MLGLGITRIPTSWPTKTAYFHPTLDAKNWETSSFYGFQEAPAWDSRCQWVSNNCQPRPELLASYGSNLKICGTPKSHWGSQEFVLLLILINNNSYHYNHTIIMITTIITIIYTLLYTLFASPTSWPRHFLGTPNDVFLETYGGWLRNPEPAVDRWFMALLSHYL